MSDSRRAIAKVGKPDAPQRKEKSQDELISWVVDHLKMEAASGSYGQLSITLVAGKITAVNINRSFRPIDGA